MHSCAAGPRADAGSVVRRAALLAASRRSRELSGFRPRTGLLRRHATCSAIDSMKMVCAWCHEVEKSGAAKAAAKESDRQTSYTICPTCVDAFFPGLLPHAGLKNPALHIQ
jgi:hypothetical protein